MFLRCPEEDSLKNKNFAINKCHNDMMDSISNSVESNSTRYYDCWQVYILMTLYKVLSIYTYLAIITFQKHVQIYIVRNAGTRRQ